MFNQKKHKQSINMEMKLEIIKRYELGHLQKDIAASFNLSPSTVSSICSRDAHKIKKCAEDGIPLTETMVNRHNKTKLLYDVEDILDVWVEEQMKENKRLTHCIIRKKAISIYEELLKKKGHKKHQRFNASNGWLWKYRIKMICKNQKVPEIDATGLSFPYTLSKIIEEGNYQPQQVFTANETVLFWRRNFGASRRKKLTLPPYKQMDSLIVLLSANASGDFKLKPLLQYSSDKPDFKDVDKSEFGVIWKNSRHGCMTATIFEHWFRNDFIPKVYEYYEDNNIDRKILLILNTGSQYVFKYFCINDNIKIIFIPSKTTSYRSPIDLNIFTTFKAYYYYAVYKKASKSWKANLTPSAKAFFHDFTLMEAIELIAKAWLKVPNALLNAVWFELWPKVVQYQDILNNEEDIKNILQKALHKSQKLGLDYMELEIFQKWIRDSSNSQSIKLN